MKHVVGKAKDLIERYERHISSAALLGGFILDSLTLQRIDRLFENLVLVFYIFVAGLSIFIINLVEGGALRGKFFERLHSFLPVLAQFAFGGLFSGFLVFYFRSATIASAWPFVLILLGLLIGNELFKRYYARAVFHLAIFFFTIYLFLIFSVPIVLGKMGDGIFVLSGLVAVIVMTLFVWFISFFVREKVRAYKELTAAVVVGILLGMNALYFTNIIPPIPLAIKDIGIYHLVESGPQGFRVEKEVFAQPFFRLRDTVHVVKGQPLYAYSAVFAPTDLSTTIVHHWQYFDERVNRWVSKTRTEFPILGGRDGGYRGYSWKSTLLEGLWRINVETKRGQLIGRTVFNLEYVTTQPQREVELKI